jgi:hypothetical protein
MENGGALSPDGKTSSPLLFSGNLFCSLSRSLDQKPHAEFSGNKNKNLSRRVSDPWIDKNGSPFSDLPDENRRMIPLRSKTAPF